MAAGGDRRQQVQERPLSAAEWRLLAVLGLPTFAYALATTVVSTYLPVLAQDFTASSTIIGMLIAIEGVMALLIAVPAGAQSDRRMSRLPYVVFGSPVLVAALTLMGFVSSLGVAVVVVVIFFAAYFVAYEPYRALYPDLVDNDITGRAQSTQALWRGLGTILAIAAGGVLLTIGNPVPFVAGAAVTGIAVAVFLAKLPRDREPTQRSDASGLMEELQRLRRLVACEGDIRAFMLANGLWEFSLGALKTFIILYLTKGLGLSTSGAAAGVTGGAVFVALASPVSGKLADRYGTVPVMRVSLLIFGGGLVVPFLITSHLVVGLSTPVIAMGGGVMMTLPYALLIPLMRDGDHGLTTGLYSLSRGIGTALGPLVAGIAIGIFDDGTFSGTDGYQVVWGVCAAAVLASVPILGRLERAAAARQGTN